jgi:hypothetical protein
MVLDNADGSSSQVVSLSTVAKLPKGWVDATTANKVHWGTRSVVVAILSHFPKLEGELKLLRSGRNTVLTEDRADALRSWHARPQTC